jgi:hypothetical protein
MLATVTHTADTPSGGASVTRTCISPVLAGADVGNGDGEEVDGRGVTVGTAAALVGAAVAAAGADVAGGVAVATVAAVAASVAVGVVSSPPSPHAARITARTPISAKKKP